MAAQEFLLLNSLLSLLKLLVSMIAARLALARLVSPNLPTSMAAGEERLAKSSGSRSSRQADVVQQGWRLPTSPPRAQQGDTGSYVTGSVL